MLIAKWNERLVYAAFTPEDEVDTDLIAFETFQRTFPKANLQPMPNDDHSNLSDKLFELCAGFSQALPCLMIGTPFQIDVWRAVQEIPYGQTATYKDIAIRIGRPAAIRAVGVAVGANLLALTVPCHRVIGSNGAMTGYRWGLARKRDILEYEQSSLRNINCIASLPRQSTMEYPI